MTLIKIQDKEYTLTWNTRALIRYRKLPHTEDKIEDGINLLWACLPVGSFDTPDNLMDAVEIGDLPLVMDKINEVMGVEKKEVMTESPL
jgi:hypothetical protein